MALGPLISIVTPSFNQGRYIGETLQSLVDQNYPNLEVIIQDGGSTDGAVEIAKHFVIRYPRIFKLFVENDEGQADAINRGFARAKGEILGFLNSDDTLYPGCLHRVAEEIDPARDRFIVFGRCLFTGEDSPYVGVEHPATYTTHFEHLAIWKRGYNTIPQPSVFWHRRVWEQCGGLNTTEHHVLDYDLFCRFSRKFRFHKADELWSTYRMHAVSKSSQSTEDKILESSIRVSRRYWGGWWSPLRWRCAFSYWLHDRHLHERARHYARRAEEAARAGRKFQALIAFFKTLVCSPRMARDRLLVAWLAGKRLQFLERLLWGSDQGFTGQFPDLWIGPIYRADIVVPEDGQRLVLELRHNALGTYKELSCELHINGRMCSKHSSWDQEDFRLEADVVKLRGRRCQIELRCSSFFVPRLVHNSPDDRHLSLQLLRTSVESHARPTADVQPKPAQSGLERLTALPQGVLNRLVLAWVALKRLLSSKEVDAMSDQGFTGQYGDLWVGPLYRADIAVPADAKRIVLELRHAPPGTYKELSCEFKINGKTCSKYSSLIQEDFRLEAEVIQHRGRRCQIEVRSSAFFVPRLIHNSPDDRKLSLQLLNTAMELENLPGEIDNQPNPVQIK